MSQEPFMEQTRDPFAPDVDPFAEREPKWFKERDTYSPDWYDPRIHRENPLVTQNGVAVSPGFHVHEVAPERRWAIQESGELMAQQDFEPLMRRWQAGYYTLPRPHKPGFQPSPMTGSLNDEPMPRVENFVAVRIDPTDPSRVVPIFRPPKEKPRLERQWDAKAEEWRPVDLTDEKTRQIAARHGYEVSEATKEEEKPEEPPKPEAPVLTQREHQILAFRKEGKTHREIAEELGITHGYVSTLITKINKKLKAGAA